MLKGLWLFLVCFLAGGVLAAHAAVIDADSSIKRAVVYPSSARVTRMANVPLKEGMQSIRIKGVQPNFDENSLSVSGQGTAEVKILGAGIKEEFVKESPDERVRELEARILDVDDRMAALQGEADTLGEKKAFLDSVKLFNNGQLPKDLVTKVPTAEELKATLTFVEAEAKGYADATQAVNIKKRELAKERDKLRQELDQLRSGTVRSTRDLVVDVECEKAGALDLEISYTQPQVSWVPIYDARVDFEKSVVVLSSFAVLSQQTGEDWNDVELTLSTSRPTIGGQMPELSSWQVRPVMPQTNDNVEYFYSAESASESAMSGKAVALGRAKMEKVSDRKARTQYAQSESTGASMVYKVGRPVTVRADGTEVRVPVMSQTLSAVLQYATTPKLSAYAYLKSSVTNGPSDQLTAGRVNVFLDGTYVGASDIPKTIATGEVFDLYLGVDEGVFVKRELLEEKSDDTLIGSIPSSTRKTAYKYKITLENYKARAVNVDVFDHIPVAQDDKIRVGKVETSMKPETSRYKDREGVYQWKLKLQPKEKNEIVESFVVEHPRDMTIQGL